jgi:hypothetical protein
MDHTISSNADRGNRREHEVRFPDKFWRKATHLSHDAKGLYATIATFADYRTGMTFVSNDRLQSETGYGRDKMEKLLRELELAKFIERSRENKGNLLFRRWIKCLKFVVSSDALKTRVSARCPENQGTENQGTILPLVKSSVTPEERKSHPYHTQGHGFWKYLKKEF